MYSTYDALYAYSIPHTYYMFEEYFMDRVANAEYTHNLHGMV